MNRDTFRFTNWLVAFKGLERTRVKYGMSWLAGNRLPYFSITLEREERRTINSQHWQYSGGGAAHEEIADKFPELAPLIKWHLCDQDGTPMHYRANAIFWYGMAAGWNARGPYDKDPIGCFKSTVCWGALPSDGEISLAMTHRELQEMLEARLPVIQDAFVRAMAAAEVKFIDAQLEEAVS